MTADEFNSLYGIFTPVEYLPNEGDAKSVKTRCRSDAWTLANGQHVVMIEGKTGCVSLDAITVDPDYQEFAMLGKKIEDHFLDCLCSDCRAFMIYGDKRRQQIIEGLRK